MKRILLFVLFCLLKPYCEAQFIEQKKAIQVEVFPNPYRYDSHKEDHQERLIQKLGPDDAVSEFIEKAEDKSNVIINKNGLNYKALQSEIVFDGSSAFNLVVSSQTFKSTYITLNPSFKINDNTTLQFVSWMRTALVGQTARVQVSLQNGKWQEIFSQSGPMKGGGIRIDGDSSWTLRTIDLSGFTGKIVNIRFLMDAGNSAAFNDTGPNYGWFIDNIQIGSSAFEKKLYSIGQPTDDEQYSVEFINRARKDPAKELELLINTKDPDVIGAYDYFNVDMSLLRKQFRDLKTAQPLSISESLTIVARRHSRDMVENKFQGHVSSDGSTLGQRVEKVTSEFGGLAENVGAYNDSIFECHAGMVVDWGTSSTGKSKGGMQDPPGHRLNIYNKKWTQVGVGAIPNGEMIGEITVTQNFGAVGQFIIGVVFVDNNENDFYDPGEGFSGAQINSRMINGEVQSPYYAISSESGGYSVPVSSKGGNYIVSFSHPIHGNWSAHITTKDSTNEKVDWILKLKPPQITQQPQSQTVLVGETASMEVKASGRGPLEYQWYKGSNRIHGALNSIYRITKVSENHSGKYKVKVSNSMGSVFSQHAQLNLLAPPKIALQPRTQSIVLGGTTKFVVEATGTKPLEYQWYKDGQQIAGATDATCRIASVSQSDLGGYSVRVQNKQGKAYSQIAELSLAVLHTLTVASRDPDSGVTVTVSPTDNNGHSDGTTQFTRVYSKGTEVTLTADSTSGSNQFKQWLKNGEPAGTEPTVTVTMDYDRTLRAVYEPKPVTLTVASRDPDSGVTVTVSPADQNGQADGTTQFTRVYYKGTEVTLSAKQSVGSNEFKQWLANGVPVSNESTVVVTMDYDRTLRAVYVLKHEPIDINVLSKNGAPFSFTFSTILGATYEVQASHGLKKWSEIGEVQGTGSSVKFTDPRLPIVPFERNYFRVKLVE